MFECKICIEKDKRITYLEGHVERMLLRLGVPKVEDYDEKVPEDDPLLDPDQEPSETRSVFGGH